MWYDLGATPMKRTIKTILLLVFLINIGVFLVGCSKQPIQLDRGWTSPTVRNQQ